MKPLQYILKEAIDYGEHTHDMSVPTHHRDCQCARCKPFERPCDCKYCRAFRLAKKRAIKNPNDINEWRKELEYIIDMNEAGSIDWNNLVDFRGDFNTFTEYVYQRAAEAEAAGFKGIAEDMRNHRL